MPIHCRVYRSPKREYTYIYLREDLGLDDLPADLLEAFGEPEEVMELELGPDSKLAQESVADVLEHLADPGFHVQMPPTEDESGWLDLPSR